MLGDELVELLALEHERNFVNGIGDVLLLDDRFGVTLQNMESFSAEFAVDGVLRTADEDVGLDADLAQLGDTLLRGLLTSARPAALMNGTSVTCMKSVFSWPTSSANWRMASRNGRPSMSPVVPPISVMTTSQSWNWPTCRMRCLISSVTCGMTCTVLPR